MSSVGRFPEFVGIFMLPGQGRPVMSMPPTMRAAKPLIDQVRWELGIPDADAERVADWIADRMERYAALTARPVMEMDGTGPVCSDCSMLWPMCGHHHLSAEIDDDTQPVIEQ